MSRMFGVFFHIPLPFSVGADLRAARKGEAETARPAVGPYQSWGHAICTS